MNLVETARAAEFFFADGVIVSGVATDDEDGRSADLQVRSGADRLEGLHYTDFFTPSSGLLGALRYDNVGRNAARREFTYAIPVRHTILTSVRDAGNSRSEE